MMMENARVLREQLVRLLRGGMAHMTFDDAVADFPRERINERAPNVPYTPWQLLEHIRLAQHDILDFVRDPTYTAPRWPDEYWPSAETEATPEMWEAAIEGIRADLRAVEALAADAQTDLYATIPHGDGQTILREILLVADHNAYHIGEFAILRQVMGTWPPDHT